MKKGQDQSVQKSPYPDPMVGTLRQSPNCQYLDKRTMRARVRDNKILFLADEDHFLNIHIFDMINVLMCINKINLNSNGNFSALYLFR